MANKRSNTFLTGYDLTEAIFHSLCSQKLSSDYDPLSLFLPDTVIFQNGKPTVWYYSDSNGALKQSQNTELGINTIVNSFLENKPSYDVVACLIKPSQGVKKVDEKENIDRVSIEYFDEKRLRQFAKSSTSLEKGILQKFINPREDKNHAVEAIWEKQACSLTKRINCKSLKDLNININEKCVTYEGPDSLSDAMQLDGHLLSTRIKTLMTSIIKHLLRVTFEDFDIAKLVSYFKLGQNNEVWYLWTTCASVIQKNLKIQAKDIKNDAKRCSNCNKDFAQAQLANVNYQTLIEKAKGFIGSVHSNSSARASLGNIAKSSRDSSRIKGKDTKDDLIEILKLIHPTFHLKELENLTLDPSLALKKAQMCYSCYMILFNMSPRIQNPVSFRKLKEQTQTHKSHRSSASFVLRSTNKSGDTSQIANLLYLKKNSSLEKSGSLERVKQAERKDTGVLRSSVSPKKARKEPSFYLKPSSSHRRQQSSSLLSTRLEKSSSRSIGQFVLTTERNESIGRESLDFTRLSATPIGKGNQTSFSRDDKSSLNGSKSLVRIRRVRLTSQDSKFQEPSEIESVSNVHPASSYEKYPNTKSQALMMQLKQVSGSQSQIRVSERSTLDGSKDLSRTSFQNTSLLPRNGSPVAAPNSSSKKRVALTLKRDKKMSDETLKLTRTGAGGMAHSKVLSVEETNKLKSAIRQAISGKDQGSTSRQTALASDKDSLISIGRVQSVSSFNPKKSESQSSRDRRMASCSLSVKPQAEHEPKARIIPRPMIQFTNTNSIEAANKLAEFPGADEDYWPHIETKEKDEPSDANFNICNDINRGIDFIKNKTFTRNTSWLSKKGETSIIDKRSHKKSSSMSIFALTSNNSLNAKSSQDKIINSSPEVNNTSVASKPTIASISRLSIQKVCLDDVSSSMKPPKLNNQSPDLSPTHQKETIDSEGEQLKSKVTTTQATIEQPVQSQNSFKEFPLSPDAPLSETFEACLLDNKEHFNTLEVSESNDSEEGLDKAFVGGGEEEEYDINLNDKQEKLVSPLYSSLKKDQRLFTLLEDSELKSVGIPSSQKLDSKTNIEEKEEVRGSAVKSFTAELSSSKELLNNRKRVCILRKNSVIGRRVVGESIKEKKVSFKEQVEEIRIEQVQQCQTMEEDEEEEELALQAVNQGEERLTTDFSGDSELEEWPEENFENFLNVRSQGSEIIGQ